ncbi:MAG: MFS transporter [Candidatus Woesebacteria bacterium]|nr:MAG: MFS transporter [Candidatus Woesebacteria bacterium]
MTKISIKKYFSGVTKDTFFLSLVSLFADIATEMLYPILPIFLTQTLKANGSAVGLVEGIATATQNIVQGVSGYLSDKIQKRKAIAIAGYTVSALAKPLIGFSTLWQQVLGVRFMDRLGTGTRSAPRDALIAASVDKKSRGKAFGLEAVGDNLGAFLGPLLTIFLLFSLKIQIRHIFYLAVIPGLLSVLAITLVKEKNISFSSKSKLEANLHKFPKKYYLYLFVTAIFGLGVSSTSFLILQTKSIGVSLEGTILIYAFFNLIAALTSYPAGFLSDKFGRKNILLLSFVIFALTYLGFALTRNILAITILFIFYGAFQGIFRSVGKAQVVDLIPQNLKASGIGWYISTVGLTSLVASLVSGQLWDKLGHPAVFLYGALFGTMGIISLIFLI